jgi:hypothetical protein
MKSDSKDHNGRAIYYGYFGYQLGEINSYVDCHRLCGKDFNRELFNECEDFEYKGFERKRLAEEALSPLKATHSSAVLFRLEDDYYTQTDAATAKSRCIFKSDDCAGVYASSDYTKFYLATEKQQNPNMAASRTPILGTEYGAFYKLDASTRATATNSRVASEPNVQWRRESNARVGFIIPTPDGNTKGPTNGCQPNIGNVDDESVMQQTCAAAGPRCVGYYHSDVTRQYSAAAKPPEDCNEDKGDGYVYESFVRKITLTPTPPPPPPPPPPLQQLGIPSDAEIKAEQQRHWGTPKNQTPGLITAPSLQNPILVPTPTGWSTWSNSSLGNLSSPSSDPEAYLPLCKTTDQYLTGDNVKDVTKCKGLAQKESLTNPLLNYCTDPATMAFMQTYCAMSCEKLKTPCRGKPTT